MVSADVHGIVLRSEDLAENVLRIKIGMVGGNGRIVVVVARYAVHQRRIGQLAQEIVIVLQGKVIVVPIDVVAQVAQVHRINGALGREEFRLGTDGGHGNVPETLQLGFKVGIGQVGIGQENDAVAALVLADEGEIVHLLYLGSRGEVGIEIGLQAIGAHGPVARGHAQIDQPLALVAGHAVAALGVRAHDIHAIGHGNALHGTALAGHLSLQHIGTSFGVQVGQVFFGRGDARQIISLEGIPGIIGEVRRRERKGYGLAIIGQLENQVAGFFAAIEGELEGRGHRDLIGLPDIFHLVTRDHLAPAVDAHKGHQRHHAAVVAEAQAGGVRVFGQVRIGLHDDVVQHLPGHFHSPSAVERIGSFLAIIEIIIRFPQSQDIFLRKEVVEVGLQFGNAVHVARQVIAEEHEAFRILHNGSVGKVAADKGPAVHFFPEDGHHPFLPDRRIAQAVLAGSLGIGIVFLQARMGIQVPHLRLGAGGVPAQGGIALLQAFQAGIHAQDDPRQVRRAGLDMRQVLPQGRILGIEPLPESLVLGTPERGQEA